MPRFSACIFPNRDFPCPVPVADFDLVFETVFARGFGG
jgi:hypothetical protein